MPASSRLVALIPFALAGYALIGRGFAELYLCELVLVGLVLRLFLRRSSVPVLTLWPTLAILALCLWSAWRTVPFVGAYEFMAIRDMMLPAYSLLGLGVAGLIISRPQNLYYLLHRYGQFVPFYIVLLPVMWCFMYVFASVIPRIPGTMKPILLIKGGDALVHLAGVTCFLAVGLQKRGVMWHCLIGATFIMIGLAVRAGFLSFLVALSMLALLKPNSRLLWRSTVVLGVVVLLLAITGLRVKLPGLEREVSFDQLNQNLASITGSTNKAVLDGSKEWRKLWWKRIIDYTLDGPFFWTGKGFGVNLGDQDGFKIDEVGSLRSPHNGHLNMLARGGVPGITLWILTFLTWFIAMLVSYFRALSAGDTLWSRIFLFLICYWSAFIVNASFDVFLEGPIGAMWFWTVHGVGMAAYYLYRTAPHALWPSAYAGYHVERGGTVNVQLGRLRPAVQHPAA